MSTVTQQSTLPAKQATKPIKTSSDNNENIPVTSAQLTPPIILLKPPLSPKPIFLKKSSSSDYRFKSLPRNVVNPSFLPDSPKRDSSSDSTDSFPPLKSPTRRTSAGGTTRVSGMKDHWEKTIVAHREECNKQ